MGDTYATASEAEAGRGQQQALLAALNATERALRRDECGAWCIRGERGSVHTWGDGKSWVLFVRCRSVLHWTWTKKRLSFCTVVLDCEDEGTLRLCQLPTLEQANIIRDALGIPKRREISDEASVVQNNAIAASPLPEVPQEKTPIPDVGLTK